MFRLWSVRGTRTLVALLIVAFGTPALPVTVGLAQAAVLPQLPQVYLDTTYTPPTGRTITVPAGGDFQVALNAAAPGDVITLQAGATYTGPFTLPSKPGTGWIYVRTSTPDSSLPPPGSRITPTAAPLLPKIVVGPGVGGAIQAVPGAHHFRFIGIEFAPTPGSYVYSLIDLGSAATSTAQLPNNIIIDRCYLHGDPVAGGRRGIAMNSAYTAVIDSYMTDFKEVGNDSQAIMSWNGSGPFKITNNHLEAAGENIMFGGSDPTIPNLVPSDIEVRGNHFIKPLTWKVGDPSYLGTPWTVKNLFELKNAQRVLVDGNIFEQNWVGADQHGAAVLFTVRDQTGTAPWVIDADITFTHNIVRHATGGMEFLGLDPTFPSQQTQRVLVQDNLFVDIGGAQWAGADRTGRLFQVNNGIANLTIDHITAFHTENPLVAGWIPVTADPGFTLTNIIAQNGPYGVAGDGTYGNPLLTLTTFFPSATFARNSLAGATASSYPANNFFPQTTDAVGFVNLAGGDYHLATTSPYKNAGTDGKDIGANIDALNTATANAISGGGWTPAPPSSTPSLSISTSTVAFGSVTVNTTSPAQDIQVMNSGSVGASVTSVAVSGPFTITQNYCLASGTWNGVMAPGTHCDIYVAFAPTTAGSVAGTLTISSAAPVAPIPLSGSGVAVGSLSVSLTSVTFGSVPVNTTSPAQDIQVMNGGPVGVAVTSVAVSGPFTITQNYCLASGTWNGVMAPGTHCDIYVAFAPTTAGSVAGTLTISSAAPVAPIPLSGSGVAAVSLSITPTSVAFGSMAVNTTSAAVNIAIVNSGSVGASVTSVTASGPFTITQNYCLASGTWNGVMAPGTHCNVYVTFAPTAVGGVAGTLTITSAAGTYQVVVSGTGI